MFQKKNPKKLALNLSSNAFPCKSSYKKPKVTHDNYSGSSLYHAGPVRILPNLYLGAAHNAQDVYQLKKYSISTIINVASEVIKPCVIPYTIDYHHIRWTHNQDNLASLEFGRAIDLIKGAHFKNHKVLVHCQQGIERSAALIIAYLMHMSRRPRLLSTVHTKQDQEKNDITSQSLAGQNWSLDHVITFVKERANGIRPNLSEMYQLHEYDKALPLSNISRPSIQTRTRRSESIATCEPTFINPMKPLIVDTHYGQRRPRATSFRDVSNQSRPQI
ncbi:phosphatases II, partial [Backusella circina FSU 941]